MIRSVTQPQYLNGEICKRVNFAYLSGLCLLFARVNNIPVDYLVLTKRQKLLMSSSHIFGQTHLALMTLTKKTCMGLF